MEPVMARLAAVLLAGAVAIAAGCPLPARLALADESAKAQAGGTCRKYLPLLGTTIPVPCEGGGNAEPSPDPAGDEEATETCRRYLPAVGPVVPVPCEAPTGYSSL